MPKPVQDNPIKWVNYDLTKQDKAKMVEVLSNDEDLYAGLELLIKQKHRVSFGWDGNAEAFVAFAFPDKDHPTHAGMALSARSRTALGALMGLVYRHVVVFDCKWNIEYSGPHLDD